MNRATRDRFVATTDQTQMEYGESACLETPPALFAALHTEFDFQIDLTANKDNALLSYYYGPGSTDPDALTANWARTWKRGFSNPVYGAFVPKILAKAVEEQRRGFLSVFLLPVRINRPFKDLIMVHADEVRWVDERITFWYQGQPKPSARVKVTKRHRADSRWNAELSTDTEGYLIEYREQAWHPVLTAAGALFDSMIVVFRPHPIGKLHYGPRFTVWHWNAPRRAALEGRHG